MNSIYVLRLTRYKKIRLEMDACHKRKDGAVVSAFICRGKFQVRFLHPLFFFLWLFGILKIFIAHDLHKLRFGALVGRSTLVLVTHMGYICIKDLIPGLQSQAFLQRNGKVGASYACDQGSNPYTLELLFPPFLSHTN